LRLTKQESAATNSMDSPKTAAAVTKALKELAQPEKAAFFPRFFKAGPGQYGEGDKFLGVIVPNQRKIAKKFRDISNAQVIKLLDSSWHECRLTGTLILVGKYERAKTNADRKSIYDLYLKKKDRVNNWDLVDSSAHKIVGPYLEERSRKQLYTLAKSKHLWSNRIAMIATLHYIKQHDFADAIELAELLLHHEHDLMHKAVGWMLREIGNRDKKVLIAFLKKHQAEMPRTMLRYAIEKLPETQRKKALNGNL